MTRATRTGMTWLGGLALVVGMTMTPQRAEAADEDWATAGKILTGVVGLYALNHVLNDGSSYSSSYSSSPDYRSSGYYSSGYYRSSHRPHSYRYSSPRYRDHGHDRYRYRYSYRYEPRHYRYDSGPRYSSYSSYTYYTPAPAPAPQVVYNYHVTQQAPAQPERPVYYSSRDDGGDYYTPRDASYYAVATRPAPAPERRAEPAPQPQPQWQPAPQPEAAAQPQRDARPATRDVQQADSESYVVAKIGEDRRIVQPHEKGAEAMLKQYSEVHQQWIDVKTYPSIY